MESRMEGLRALRVTCSLLQAVGAREVTSNQSGEVSQWPLDFTRETLDVQNQEDSRRAPSPQFLITLACILSSLAQDALLSLSLLPSHSTAAQAWAVNQGRDLLLTPAGSFQFLKNHLLSGLHFSCSGLNLNWYCTSSEICSQFTLEIMQSTPRPSQHSLCSLIDPFPQYLSNPP